MKLLIGLGFNWSFVPIFFIVPFPVLVPRFSKILFVTLRQKKLSQEKKTAGYDLCLARSTDHLPFCVEVAKLRAKSLFLSVILLEVLFVSEWSKSNKKLLVLWSRKYLYSPHRGSLDILNGKRWGLGGGGGWVGLKDLNFKRKKYEPKLEFSDEG